MRLRVLGCSLLLGAPALAAVPTPAAPAARVIVSSTLNDTLQFLDAATLAQTQPPLPSKGAGPVRLDVEVFGGKPYLFSANHGVASGSVGVFDLSGDVVLELPASPFATALPGNVGVDAAELDVDAEPVPAVFVTSTGNALAGCGVPESFVEAFDARSLGTGALVPAGRAQAEGAQAWGVAAIPGTNRALVTANCADTVTEVALVHPLLIYDPLPTFELDANGVFPTPDGPDGILADTRFAYVTAIAASAVVARDLGRTTGPGWDTIVPLPPAGPGAQPARPIEATLARSPAGRAWIVTANDGDDSVSIIDRDVVASCVVAGSATCAHAEIARIPTGDPGGNPEGVAYDPGTNRVFVVNKAFPPSLSAIQLTEHPDGSVTGAELGPIPLGALGSSAPVPAFIAFDVVVQQR